MKLIITKREREIILCALRTTLTVLDGYNIKEEDEIRRTFKKIRRAKK